MNGLLKGEFNESKCPGIFPVDLSIIIVNWNAKDFLGKCLGSIKRHVRDISYEVIVVDNASGDGSQDYIEKAFADVILIKNTENLGFAKANNLGLSVASGKYISMVNSDTEFVENCYKKLITFIEENKNVGLIGPRITDINGNTQRSCMSFPTIPNLFYRALALDRIFPRSKTFGSFLMAYWNHDDLQKVDVVNGCFWFTKKEYIKKVGMLPEDYFIYGEDIDWCKHFRDSGYEVIFNPNIQIIHYGGASSSNAPVRFYLEMQKANFIYWKKHHSKALNLYLLSQWVHHSIRLFLNLPLSVLPIMKEKAAFKVKRHFSILKWMWSR